MRLALALLRDRPSPFPASQDHLLFLCRRPTKSNGNGCFVPPFPSHLFCSIKGHQSRLHRSCPRSTRSCFVVVKSKYPNECWPEIIKNRNTTALLFVLHQWRGHIRLWNWGCLVGKAHGFTQVLVRLRNLNLSRDRLGEFNDLTEHACSDMPTYKTVKIHDGQS